MVPRNINNIDISAGAFFCCYPKYFFARFTRWLILVFLLMTLLYTVTVQLLLLAVVADADCSPLLLLLVVFCVRAAAITSWIFCVPAHFVPGVNCVARVYGFSSTHFRARIVSIDFFILLTKQVQFMQIIQIPPGEDVQITQTKIPLRSTPDKYCRSADRSYRSYKSCKFHKSCNYPLGHTRVKFLPCHTDIRR